MKHNLKVTLFLLLLFFAAQIIGLMVTKSYLQETQLPLGIERPIIEEQYSYLPILIAIIFATVIALVLIKFRAVKVWKFWYFFSVFFTLLIAIGAFLNEIWAFLISLVLSIFKVFKRNFIIHNATELLIYGGLAGLFVPILNLESVVIILIAISIYDVIAVWKTKHMVEMAKFQSDSKLFAGLNFPYKIVDKKINTKVKEVRGEVKEAILGGGDIGFPLLFNGVVLKQFGFPQAVICVVFASIALLLLFLFSKKNKFYPAMPFLSIGCFIGFLVSLLI